MEPFEQEVNAQRLGWFIRLRWMAVAGGLLILLVAPALLPLEIKYSPLILCLVLLGIFNAAYMFFWKRFRAGAGTPPVFGNIKSFFHLQMVVDLILLTVLLFYSGGAGNPLLLFYLFHLAIGVMIFPVTESLLYGGLALLLPWLLYFSRNLYPLDQHLWQGISGFTEVHERSILLAYSLAAMGLWFFLSRLASDIKAKEKALRQAHGELRAANDQLEQLDAYKNQFLSHVVYQLKTPAIDMDFDLSAVERALPRKNDQAERAIQTAKKRVWTLLELIDDLVWLSKVRAQSAPFQKEWVDVYETILGRIQALEKEAGRKGITFKLHGEPATKIRADKEAFERVASNLLSNAVKYTPEGVHTILAEFQVLDGMLLFSVQDEGIGIPPKQQEKIFQEFFRASNAKSMEKFGTGLGLSIVKHVLDWHGGRVNIVSGAKQGTKVETYWPVGDGIKEILPIDSPTMERRSQERNSPGAVETPPKI
ncbi:MAG TPA: HAMP domain-containing sensor histidine kinase [bacterium]|nr:HAMP domain-containing sensor histidine kinase [bacterium]